MIKKTGFTLIELVVVVGVLGAVMAATSSVLINAFKANSRVKLTDRLSQDGNWTLMEVRKNVFNSKSTNIICSGGVDIGSSSVSMRNINDDEETTIVCLNNKIASVSASRTIDLTNSGSEVTVSCGDSFAICSGSPTSSVTFNFTLSIGNSNAETQSYVQKIFNSTVAVRN